MKAFIATLGRGRTLEQLLTLMTVHGDQRGDTVSHGRWRSQEAYLLTDVGHMVGRRCVLVLFSSTICDPSGLDHVADSY